MLRIELPWPDPILSPNKRPHWAQKNKAYQKDRLNAFSITPSATTLCKCENESEHANACELKHNYTIRVTFYPKSNRRMDLDNALASCKALFDGMCDKLGIDDSQLCPITIDWGEKIKGGKVLVEIEL